MAAPPENWYVDVVIEDPPDSGVCSGYSIGPLASWSVARDLSARWEKEHGENTARVTARKAGYFDRRTIEHRTGTVP